MNFRPVCRFLIVLSLLWVSNANAYSVSQGRLVDARGQAIQLRGVNWFGFETDTHAPHGLWARPWREMLSQMKALKINALRVPLCPETIRGVPIEGVDGDLNPDLIGFNSAELLDFLVQQFSDEGFLILLDHHRPNCQSQSELWYTTDYSEAEWINDLSTLAKRFRDVPGVIGIDLKNEPKGRATWGTGNQETDWNAAAERASRAVLGIAPEWLIFVEGVENNPECSSEGPHFWGENLQPFACTPLDIPPDRLVLAPHTYGPDVYPQPYFDDPRFPANMPAIWERNFGQFLAQGYAVILGEFGGKYGEGDPRDRAWQDMLVDYLLKLQVRSAFYWSWNPNSEDTGGLLQDDWKTLRQDKIDLLHRFWFGSVSKAMGTQSATGSPKRQQPGRSEIPAAVTGVASIRRQLLSRWDQGYCEQIEVTNTQGRALAWTVNLPVEGEIQQLWNAEVQGRGDSAQFSGVDWNAVLENSGQTHFGFCVSTGAGVANQSMPGPSQGESAKVGRKNSPIQTPVRPINQPEFSVTVQYDNDWGAGYCSRVTVTNRTEQVQQWQLVLDIEGRVENLWQGRWQQNGQRLTVQGESYNQQLAPRGNQSFGFCAKR